MKFFVSPTRELCNHHNVEVPYKLRKSGIFPEYDIYKKPLKGVIKEDLKWIHN